MDIDPSFIQKYEVSNVATCSTSKISWNNFPTFGIWEEEQHLVEWLLYSLSSFLYFLLSNMKRKMKKLDLSSSDEVHPLGSHKEEITLQTDEKNLYEIYIYIYMK